MKNKCKFLLLSVVLFPVHVSYQIVPIPSGITPTVIEVPSVWEGYPLLERIAACESTGDVHGTPRQFLPNGQVLRGYPNPDDIGELQINAPTWQKKAESLGYDIYTQEGNITMGKWIFDNDSRHAQNWKWSEKCWAE